jgi:hypothetical protein
MNVFCREVLCTEFIAEVAQANFVCWAGVAGTPETANLAQVGTFLDSRKILVVLCDNLATSSQRIGAAGHTLSLPGGTQPQARVLTLYTIDTVDLHGPYLPLNQNNLIL